MPKRQMGLHVLLACLMGLAPGVLRPQDDSMNWLGDYREALREARRTGKPILLEFRCEA
jgi:hypothetical protein